jgi:hypothetical protein
MISFESAASIPDDIVHMIEPLKGQLMQARFVDSVARTRSAQPVLARMTQYLEQTGIIGIHYTRAVPGDISAGGLICATGAERRAWFLEKYGHHFRDCELETIKAAWRQYFTDCQNSVRDSKVFFCLTMKALVNGGAAPLLENFGGEAINMPLVGLPGITDKIRSLGSPLIVKCALKPSELHCSWDYHAAVVWLSAYHTQINSQAALYDVDVYTTSSIPPQDIISIEVAKEWA